MEPGILNKLIRDFAKEIESRNDFLSARDTGSNYNTNRTNPFIDNGGTVKQTGDDQGQIAKEGYNPVGGYLPVNANTSRNVILKKALFDTSLTVPGMGDPSNGPGAPFSAAGETPEENRPKPRDWQDLTDKSRVQQRYIRNPKDKSDYMLPGILDPASDSIDYNGE